MRELPLKNYRGRRDPGMRMKSDRRRQKGTVLERWAFMIVAPNLYEIPIPDSYLPSRFFVLLLSFLETNLRSLSARSCEDRDKQ